MHRQLAHRRDPEALFQFAIHHRTYFTGTSFNIFFNSLSFAYKTNPQNTNRSIENHSRFMNYALVQASQKIDSFHVYRLTELSQSLAVLNIRDESLLDAIALKMIRYIKSDDPAVDGQVLADMTSAFVRLDFFHKNLFHAIAHKAIYKLTLFKNHEINVLLKNFAKIGFRHGKLMHEAAIEIMHRMNTLNPHQISGIAYAFASFGMDSPRLFQAIAKQTLKKISLFEEINISKLAWSFAAVGWRDKSFFEKIYDHILKNNFRFNMTDVTQLMTVDCYLKYKFKANDLILFKDPTSELSSKKDHHDNAFNQSLSISDEIRNDLEISHFKWESNSRLEIFELDLALPEQKINIEIDGDLYHYDTQGRLYGGNLLRDYILNLMGWKVLRVKVSFWLSMDIERRRIWLWSELNKVGYSTQ